LYIILTPRTKPQLLAQNHTRPIAPLTWTPHDATRCTSTSTIHNTDGPDLSLSVPTSIHSTYYRQRLFFTDSRSKRRFRATRAHTLWQPTRCQVPRSAHS
jgi:hypothetical protein